MHIFLPQLLGPVAAENCMRGPLKEMKNYDAVTKETVETSWYTCKQSQSTMQFD